MAGENTLQGTLEQYLDDHGEVQPAAAALAEKLEKDGPDDWRLQLLIHGIAHKMSMIVGSRRTEAKQAVPERPEPTRRMSTELVMAQGAQQGEADLELLPQDAMSSPAAPLRIPVRYIKAPQTIPGKAAVDPAKGAMMLASFIMNSYTIGDRPIALCRGREVRSLIGSKVSTINTHAQDLPWLEWIAGQVADEEIVGEKVDVMAAQNEWERTYGKVQVTRQVA